MFSWVKKLFYCFLGVAIVAVAYAIYLYDEIVRLKEEILLLEQILIPVGAVLLAVFSRQLYKELCYEKLNTLEMLANTQKELDETRQELAEVKAKLERIETSEK